MKKSVILLLILGLFLESRPNFFKNFFYTQKKETLRKGSFLVAEDGFDLSAKERVAQTYKFSQYKFEKFGREVGKDQTDCMEQFFVRREDYTNQYDYIKEITILSSALKNNIVLIDGKQRPELNYTRENDRVSIKKEKSPMLETNEDIFLYHETVLNKTRVVLTVITACLIGYFAQGYVRSGAKAN